MKLKTSIIAIAALSSMSFAGGDIGSVTTFETGDVVAAEVEAVETPVEEVVDTPVQPEPQKVVETPKKEEPKVVEKPSSAAGPLYLGGALSLMGARADDRVNLFKDEGVQDRQIGLTGVVGYDFMKYLGAELRAAMGVAKDDYDKMKQLGVYLKPQYPIGETGIDIYGLLGYSWANMSDAGKLTGNNHGFSYGAGLDYGLTENVSIFTDLVNYLKDDDTNSQWGANLGVKYNF